MRHAVPCANTHSIVLHVIAVYSPVSIASVGCCPATAAAGFTVSLLLLIHGCAAVQVSRRCQCWCGRSNCHLQQQQAQPR
jgi:hypothetical protein